MARIEDYALIGDGRSAALVDRLGSIDWLCWPRFDADTCFAALIGDADNGRWRITPCEPVLRATRRYLPDNLVLETTLETGSGTVTLLDWMSWDAKHPAVVRRVRCESGSVKLACDIAIRFNYGKAIPWYRAAGKRHQWTSGPHALWLDSNVELHCNEGDLAGQFTLHAGVRQDFVLGYAQSYDDEPSPPNPEASLRTTTAFWSAWSTQGSASGPYAEAIQRSLMTLKALSSIRTGGLIAAPTSSLPERIGGALNWDYRYCWLRDASFALLALVSGGYRDDAIRWRDWLVRAMAGHPSQLQIVYTVDGSRRLPEWECGWLSGYEDSKPVRFGNAAVDQTQLDIYGEVLNALYMARLHGLAPNSDAWKLECQLVDHLRDVWHEPDDSIWEVRSGRRQFTLSKVMAWVAVDRALRSANEFGNPGPVDAWRRLASQIHADVLRHGFNTRLDAFTGTYGGDELDASLLLLPIYGFLPVDDPRTTGTVRAIERHLSEDGLLLRYRPGAYGGGTQKRAPGAFLACNFWLAHVQHLQGRHREARELFERLLALRNDVGLLSEQYDLAEGRLCGNFPQAISHVALINAAIAMTAPSQAPP